MSFDPITFSAVKAIKSKADQPQQPVQVSGPVETISKDIGTLSMVPSTYNGTNYVLTGRSFDAIAYPELASMFSPIFNGKDIIVNKNTHLGKIEHYSSGWEYTNEDALATKVFKVGNLTMVSYGKAVAVSTEGDFNKSEIVLRDVYVLGVKGTKLAVHHITEKYSRVYDFANGVANKTFVTVTLPSTPDTFWWTSTASVSVHASYAGMLISNDLVTWRYVPYSSVSTLSYMQMSQRSAMISNGNVIAMTHGITNNMLYSVDNGTTWASIGLTNITQSTGAISSGTDNGSSAPIIYNNEIYLLRSSGTTQALVKLNTSAKTFSLVTKTTLSNVAMRQAVPGSVVYMGGGKFATYEKTYNYKSSSSNMKLCTFVDITNKTITQDTIPTSPSNAVFNYYQATAVTNVIGGPETDVFLFAPAVNGPTLEKLVNGRLPNVFTTKPLPVGNILSGSATEFTFGEYSVVIFSYYESITTGIVGPGTKHKICATRDGWATHTSFYTPDNALTVNFGVLGDEFCVFTNTYSVANNVYTYKVAVHSTSNFSSWNEEVIYSGATKHSCKMTGKGEVLTVGFANEMNNAIIHYRKVGQPSFQSITLTQPVWSPSGFNGIFSISAPYGGTVSALKLNTIQPDGSVKSAAVGINSYDFLDYAPVIKGYNATGSTFRLVIEIGMTRYTMLSSDGGTSWVTATISGFVSDQPIIVLGSSAMQYGDLNGSDMTVAITPNIGVDPVNTVNVSLETYYQHNGDPIYLGDWKAVLMPTRWNKSYSNPNLFTTSILSGKDATIPEIVCDVPGAMWAVKAK